MKAHMEKTRSSLGDLGALAAKTEAAERRILEASEARLDDVNATLGRMHTGIEGAPDSEHDRYLDLVRERGQLNVVIARARANLGAQ